MELTTSYMGLQLSNPLVASASPLSHTLDGVRRLIDGGIGAVVLHSLFEEELAEEAEREATLAEAGTESFAESLTYFPPRAGGELGPRRYLSLLERAAGVVEVPVIASLNGTTPDGWTGYAQALEDAGAVALELNTYSSPSGPDLSGREIEQRLVDVLESVKAAVAIPVAVKLSPYLSSIGEMARRLDDAGADGLVLFNRFLHPDLDVESLAVVPGLGLSHPTDGRLPRTWIALLRGRVQASLAASTGVDGPDDLVKHLLAGAEVVMTTSSLLRHGPAHSRALLEGLSDWMARKGFTAIGEVRGKLAVAPEEDETARERAAYVAALRAANASTRGPW